ncbi:MAG: phosphoribosylformylglycinamidine synthase subunit PurL [Flavobacteriales bacterium]|nr:phosphoribosylformylglycinamidine synthase subunit PurL [Flavobacteriales bacterium]MDW8409812.1 phosphoribosylformylglycinamidine synthase subunit PurL [Flavobacteriales bacterium]
MESPATTESTSVATAQKLGLLPEEYDRICEILGRRPNFTELCAYSGMWSEHCSYKNSIKYLKTLPRKGPRVLAEAGQENAGLLDIGDGWACVFKIESHNHPSAIEPYQGAATGVGGIHRDIFTMGARPVAQLNSLRFGNLQDPRVRRIVRGVVRGIGDYGNAFGVPNVGGEVFVNDSFTQNPLVNAMSVGIVRREAIISATARGPGNPVFIVGSATGKDGIHGASFASGDLTEDSIKDLPAVQVGDPFQEKLLLEATLELASTGTIVGMQDMGAAGIICSTSEMSARGEVGMEIHLDQVPTRGGAMQPYELLLSESQERMLVVVKKGCEDQVRQVFEKWDLHCALIGHVTEGPYLRFYFHGQLVAELPASSLVLGGGAPQYDREYRRPTYMDEVEKFRPDQVPQPHSLREVSLFLIGHPNIASKQWIYRQYDSMVGTVNMSTNRPSDAAVVRLHENGRGLALTVDGNSRYVFAHPEIGAMIAVAEAARNIAATGGAPVGITNCLNFGNPYNPEVYWQFVHAIRGMARACEFFQIPVTGGNVSFYNQTQIGNQSIPVYPTPTIGMVGLLDDPFRMLSIPFKAPGHSIWLLGVPTEDLAGSEYVCSYHKIELSPPPYVNLEEELRLHNLLRYLSQQGLAASSHDVSDGGLICCLLEKAILSDMGFALESFPVGRADAFLFGEAQGRCVVTTDPQNDILLLQAAERFQVPALRLGHVQEQEISVFGESWGSVSLFAEAYYACWPGIMAQDTIVV